MAAFYIELRTSLSLFITLKSHEAVEPATEQLWLHKLRVCNVPFLLLCKQYQLHNASLSNYSVPHETKVLEVK